jgi:hypothetical protein
MKIETKIIRTIPFWLGIINLIPIFFTEVESEISHNIIITLLFFVLGFGQIVVDNQKEIAKRL